MSMTFFLEPAAQRKEEKKAADSSFLNESGAGQSDEHDHAASATSAEVQPTTIDATTLLNEAAALIASATAGDSDRDSPRLSSRWATPPLSSSSAPKPIKALDSMSASTRGAHKPAVLSLSLCSFTEEDAVVKEEEKAAPASNGGAAATTTAAATTAVPSFTSNSPTAATTTTSLPSPQPVDETKATTSSLPSKRPTVVVPYTSSTPSESSDKTPLRVRGAARRSSSSAAPAVPVLRLPTKKCTDEVTPVKTLYNRLFHEAQQREQRLQLAQQKQRAAQKAMDKESCTFHPRGAEAFGLPSPVAERKHLTSAEHSTQSAAAPTSPAPAPAPAANSRSPSLASKAHRSSVSTTTAETAAFERLYKNAEQAERRERRLQELREAQEEEFRSACTFHPCVVVSSSRDSRPRSLEGEGNSEEENHHVRRGASADRSGSSPHGHQKETRSWQHFLADQEERQAIRERHLKELKKLAAEQDHAKLFTGVPRSKADVHLKAYLKKKKGYKGPIEGWSERFEHYMKVKQAAEAEPSTRSPAKQKKDCAAERNDGAVRTRSTGDGGRGGRSASVFYRLYHDSDEREAMRELIRLMKEQHEQASFFNPNVSATSATNKGGSNTNNNDGSSIRATPRHSQASPRQTDAACETAAAVAVATAGEAADQPQDQQQQQQRGSTAGDDSHSTARSIFDALYAETEKLQQRRELRHLQAQNDAEVYSFHPHLSSRSRALLRDAARQKARGEREETVRERRAREAAQAAADEAARRAQVHFRYNSFAHRQAERDRRRDEEMLRILLHERCDDVEACRFRPVISEVTEAIVEGSRSYAQVIDDPQVMQNLLAQRAASTSTVGNSSSLSAARQSASQPAAEGARFTNSVRAGPAITPVQALAAGAEEADPSLNVGTSSQFCDPISAPINTFSATSSNSSVNGFCRTEQQDKPHSPLPVKVRFSSAKESAGPSSPQRGCAGSDLDTVHIAGAASSEYLRRLESELQDALRDWSQCI